MGVDRGAVDIGPGRTVMNGDRLDSFFENEFSKGLYQPLVCTPDVRVNFFLGKGKQYIFFFVVFATKNAF